MINNLRDIYIEGCLDVPDMTGRGGMATKGDPYPRCQIKGVWRRVCG